MNANFCLQKYAKLAYKSGAGTSLSSDGTVDWNQLFLDHSDVSTGAIADDWALFPFVWSVEDLRHRTVEYRRLSGEVIATGADFATDDTKRHDDGKDDDSEYDEDGERHESDGKAVEARSKKRRADRDYTKLLPALANDGTLVQVPPKKRKGRTPGPLILQWDAYDRACAEEMDRRLNNIPEPMPKPSGVEM